MCLDLESRDGGLFLIASGPAGVLCEHPVAWADGSRSMLVQGNAANGAAGPAALDPVALAEAVDQGRATPEDIKQYGMLLFDAAFDRKCWDDLVGSLQTPVPGGSSGPYLELAIRGQDSADQLSLQALRWEALHDDTGAVAAQGAAGGAVPVAIVRLVTQPGSTPFQQIDRIPRVLFAVGSHLADPRVRPGAEFMGIMRRLERDGGSIHPRVLEEATREALRVHLASFQPDVLHLIGHGQLGSKGQVRLQLRPEPSMKAGEEYVTAEQLLGTFGEAGHIPKVVILSACQTAAADQGENRVNALPFAARLAAGGVQVVVAMAGDIADTACRVFTRALATAIGQGVPLVKAVITGRRAAFYNRPYQSVDWMMPTVFLTEQVPGETCLVGKAPAAAAVRERILSLELVQDPVFFGRGKFISAMDRLLDADDEVNVVLASTPDQYQSFGGERLLREMGSCAVRAGVLPVLLAPFDQNPPKTRELLARELSRAIETIRDVLDLPSGPPARILRAVADGLDADGLARELREDLRDLVAALPEADLVRARRAGQPRILLLLHRVDGWEEGLELLLGMLGKAGLKGGTEPVPVVMTGVEAEVLKAPWNNRVSAKPWFKSAPLGRFPTKDDEDILAYQWWLLNPPKPLSPEDKRPAYAPKRGASPNWHRMLRHAMRNCIYDEVELFGWAESAVDYFTPDADDDLLASYAKAAP